VKIEIDVTKEEAKRAVSCLFNPASEKMRT
jgi:hypothetical protein